MEDSKFDAGQASKRKMSDVRLYFMRVDADSSETSCIVWVCEHSSWFFDENTMFFLTSSQNMSKVYTLFSHIFMYCSKTSHQKCQQKKTSIEKIMLGKPTRVPLLIQIFTHNGRCRGEELFGATHQHHP